MSDDKKTNMITQFNNIMGVRRKPKKNVAKGPIDLKEVRGEIKENQKKFRRP